jgi:hypothetical protein
MQAKFTHSSMLAVIIIVLVIAQVASICWFSKENRDVRRQVQDARQENALLYNEIDSIAQQHALSPLPGVNRLYLAELNLTVPLTEMSRSVRYQWAPADGDIRLTSAYMTDHETHIKSCADMVRLKIEPRPDVYSPEQPLYTTVMLADGRTLQVYASTTKECQASWQMVSPQEIAESFKDARSY